MYKKHKALAEEVGNVLAGKSLELRLCALALAVAAEIRSSCYGVDAQTALFKIFTGSLKTMLWGRQQ